MSTEILEKGIKELARRIQAIESLEEIKKLKARYAEACDYKYNLEKMMEIFTEDAVWDGGKQFGVHKGREEIRALFTRASKTFPFAIHYFVQPNIRIKGDKAYGRWYMFMAATSSDNRAVWLAGYEDDEYALIKGRWWQSRLKLTLLFQTPYEEGWHRKRFM